MHRYDGAVIERDRRERVIPIAVQPRDLAIVRDVWRYRFLTTDQLLELRWPGASAQAGRRRLVKLFRAGYLERFRPVSRRGSYPCGRSPRRRSPASPPAGSRPPAAFADAAACFVVPRAPMISTC